MAQEPVSVKASNVQVVILEDRVNVIVTAPAGNLVETSISAKDGTVIVGTMQS